MKAQRRFVVRPCDDAGSIPGTKRSRSWDVVDRKRGTATGPRVVSNHETRIQARTAADECEGDGIIDRCYFCHGEWGKCACNFPSVTSDDGTVVDDAATVPGFEWGGCYITAPNVSVCGRFYVEPNIYYGAAYAAVRGRYESGRSP